MDFFISSEVEADVDSDFQEIRKEIEPLLKKLNKNDYGKAINEIGIIPIVVKLIPEYEEAGFFKERVLYNKKNKDADIRLRINHAKFKESDKKIKKLLIIKNIITSIKRLDEKIKEGFDGEKLEKDVMEVLNIDEAHLNKVEL